MKAAALAAVGSVLFLHKLQEAQFGRMERGRFNKRTDSTIQDNVVYR